MADTAALKKNLEKVSYGTAGVLAVILVAIPFTMTGKVKKSTAEVEERTGLLADKKNQRTPSVQGVTFTSSALSKIWVVDPDESTPRWYTQSCPSILRVFSDAPASEVIHEAPCITSIELVREEDTKKPLLRVTGTIGPVEHASIVRVSLERKEGDGNWERVPGFDEAESFTFDDTNIKEGELYTYRASSEVKPEIHNGKMSVLASGSTAKQASKNELATAEPIPVDIAIQISGFSDPVVDAISAVKGVLYYFDYSEGKSKRIRPPGTSKGWERGFTFGEDIDGKPRYRFDRVTPETKTIRIVDNLTKKKTTYKQDARKGLAKTDTWESVTDDCGAGAAADEDDADTAAGDTAAGKAGAAKKAGGAKKAAGSTETAPKKSSGGRRKRRGFGE